MSKFKRFTLKDVGSVSIDENDNMVIIDGRGVQTILYKNFDIHVSNFDGERGNNMSKRMSFTEFMHACIKPGYIIDDDAKALCGWIDVFHVKRFMQDPVTTTLDNLLWEKTYEAENAVTDEEKAVTVGGWHVFTDGKETAIIWSSEGLCPEIVPLIDKEVTFIDTEFAVIKL